MTDNPHVPALEDLAAEALATARVVDTAIREDVLHLLKPLERTGSERLLRAIASKQIFDARTLDELVSLEERLARRIIDGTVMIDRVEAGEGNVSPAFWQEPRRSEEADALSRALSVILELKFFLEAVQDRLAAEAAIESLRQAL